MLLLLAGELLAISLAFDTQDLERIPALWARLLGFSPEYLRVAVTASLFAVLLSGHSILLSLREVQPDARRVRPRMLALHLVALLVFTWLTSVVMGDRFRSMSHQGGWALAWTMVGALSMMAWGLAAFRAATWLVILRSGRRGILWGLAAGIAAWTGGFLTQESWRPLVGYTFFAVRWMLGGIYPDAVSDPSTLIVGTPGFSVKITPACSGSEGIGLILVFLSIYLWLQRREFRFPLALLLLPLGAATTWLLNVGRIAALVVIGTSGWPAVALGGFHSQAGWLAFNAVGLGFVAVTSRGRYFMTPRPAAVPGDRVADPPQPDPTAAYVVPLLAMVATAMVTGAFSTGFDWFYPARVVAVGWTLWAFRAQYTEFRWRWSWRAIGIGAFVFAIWLLFMPAAVGGARGWPPDLQSVGAGWAALWLVARIVGYVVTAPLAEELAFRGFLPRRLVRADFQNLPVGRLSVVPVLVSSVLFGALHGQFWLAGTIAGLLFTAALHQRGALGDAVQAHATTNVLLALYVFATGHWAAWS